MKNVILTILLSGCFVKQMKSQEFHTTPVKINDLVHTKLEVRFDYEKQYVYGKEWITLKPHFYKTDSLLLDAKGLDISNVSIIESGNYIPLKYNYDNLSLNIKLNRVYNSMIVGC